MIQDIQQVNEVLHGNWWKVSLTLLLLVKLTSYFLQYIIMRALHVYTYSAVYSTVYIPYCVYIGIAMGGPAL